MPLDRPADADTVFDSAFREALQLDAEARVDGLAYGRSPEWDSVAHLTLIAALEQAFVIDIDAADVLETSSYPRLRSLLRDRYGVELTG